MPQQIVDVLVNEDVLKEGVYGSDGEFYDVLYAVLTMSTGPLAQDQ